MKTWWQIRIKGLNDVKWMVKAEDSALAVARFYESACPSHERRNILSIMKVVE